MGTDEATLREDEIPKATRLLSWGFAFPIADGEPWLRKAGLENAHVLRRGDAIDAALLTIPMGQFIGGGRVPMVGFAGVATSAEARGTGAAVSLMTRVLRAKRDEGFAISALYPATLGLYRKLGYELAGAHFTAKADLASITLRDRALPLRDMTPEDAPAVEACYRAKAQQVNGFLDRGPYVWRRAREPREATARGFVVGEPGNVEGYAFLFERRDASLHFALHASDFVATTARAYRRLLTFAADHGTLGTSLQWSAAPTDPSVHLLPRVGHTMTLGETWMLRLLDLPHAMRARGWPPHARIDVDLEVTDDLFAENAGRWTLHVAEGRAELTRGGTGAVQIDVRALAALYTSWLDARTLGTMGALVATDAEQAALAAAFAGASPWTSDFF
jgi:predicted acetyltransferase